MMEKRYSSLWLFNSCMHEERKKCTPANKTQVTGWRYTKSNIGNYKIKGDLFFVGVPQSMNSSSHSRYKNWTHLSGITDARKLTDVRKLTGAEDWPTQKAKS